MIGGGEIMGRINHTPNFFHFKNQQSSLDNQQSGGKNAGTVPAYAAEQPNSLPCSMVRSAVDGF
jgi:hypothetical protein